MRHILLLVSYLTSLPFVVVVWSELLLSLVEMVLSITHAIIMATVAGVKWMTHHYHHHYQHRQHPRVCCLFVSCRVFVFCLAMDIQAEKM